MVTCAQFNQVMTNQNPFFLCVQLSQVRDAAVAHWVQRVPYRLSPDRSAPGSEPARGRLMHVLHSISHTILSISLYNKEYEKAKKNVQIKIQLVIVVSEEHNRCVWSDEDTKQERIRGLDEHVGNGL